MRFVVCPNHQRSRLRRPRTACFSASSLHLIFCPCSTMSSIQAASPRCTARDIAPAYAMKRASISSSAQNQRMAPFFARLMAR
jgi:hypothetical protein